MSDLYGGRKPVPVCSKRLSSSRISPISDLDGARFVFHPEDQPWGVRRGRFRRAAGPGRGRARRADGAVGLDRKLEPAAAARRFVAHHRADRRHVPADGARSGCRNTEYKPPVIEGTDGVSQKSAGSGQCLALLLLHPPENHRNVLALGAPSPADPRAREKAGSTTNGPAISSPPIRSAGTGIVSSSTIKRK